MEKFVISIIIMIIGMKVICECCLESERNALLQIKSIFLPKSLISYSSVSSWGILDCCRWENVECNSTTGHITAIDLFSNLYGWYLNVSLFPHLNRLRLVGYKIAGCIHDEGFERLSVLTNLETLDLSDNNKFNNNNGLPSFNFTEIDGLTNLQELDLGGNEITEFLFSKGSTSNLSVLYLDNMTSTTGISNLLQQSLHQWPDLKNLSLRDNNFKGFQIFGEVFNNLESLDLSDSQFDQSANDVLQNIGRVSSLKYLRMDRCGLSGKIDASQGLCNLNHLQYLHMIDNDLTGNLPLCLANLTSLRFLYLFFNLFQIPISLSPFFNLSQLTELSISYNSIYADTEDHNLNPKFQLELLSMNGYGEGGTLPKFLYHQRNLKYLYMRGLQMSGEFPYWLLQNNTSLEYLDLSNNSLSGSLQLPYKPHVSMRYLDISDNFFNGSIPSQFGVFFPSLQLLYMSGNKLIGLIPNSLCNVAPLSYMDISQNNISGKIPKCIGNLSLLHLLDLSSNDFVGNLPSNFTSSSLRIVNLSKNRLQGSLKNAFYSCINLFQLDLSHNKFSGSIPSWIGELHGLSFLMLGYNDLQGRIPIELCNLKQLSFIDLSHNGIVGQMLPCLNITSYWSREREYQQIEDTEITMKGRTYMYKGEVLWYVTGIDTSSNCLTGQIPTEIGDLKSLKHLNLPHNRLRGSIPPTFSNLKEIESLDLSHNNLVGTIPPQLTQLTSLSFFNVSYNNLSGQTPNQEKQFATFGESSYEGNPFLCGWPLSKSCTTPDSPPSKATISPDNGDSNNMFIDMEDFFVSFGVAYALVLLTFIAVLCINPYWRRVWFYYVQRSIDNTCYFIIDNVIPLFSR